MPPLILGLGVLVANGIGSWAWLSGSDYVPDFSDLKQITYTADCVGNDPAWSLSSETCDPNGRAYNYPALWARGFAALGIGSAYTTEVGVALIVALIVAIGVLGWLARGAWTGSAQHPQRLIAVTVWLVSCVSPPFWLAMDRGNSDILILAIVVLAVVLSTASVGVLPGLLVALAGLLKVFALGSGLMLLAQRRARVVTLAAWVVGSVLAILLLLPDLALISARTPRSHWMSFGASVIPIRHQQLLGSWEGSGRAIGVVALVLFVLGILLVALLLRVAPVGTAARKLQSSLVSDPRAASLFLGGSGAFLAAYIVGTGYDYRLMFLALTVGGLLLASRSGSWAALAPPAGVVLLMWCSGPWSTLGDLADWVWLLAAPALGLLTLAVAWALLRRDRPSDSPLLMGKRTPT